MTDLSRRHFLVGAMSAAASLALPETTQAESPMFTIDTYPFQEDNITAPKIGVWNDVPLDISLLHPVTGGATIGFYASLDRYHGQPFDTPWKNVYRTYMRDKSVHDTDRGTMIQIVNHIRAHAAKAEQFRDAYYIAKEAWDQNPNLRLIGQTQPLENSL